MEHGAWSMEHGAWSMEHIGNRIGFMQDNALCHKAALTTRFLRAHGDEPIAWPAFSPDLNPIEAVWSLMKIFIQTNYPEFERSPQRSRDEVREIVEEAWDAITPISFMGCWFACQQDARPSMMPMEGQPDISTSK
ncbi:hypothetical protein K3495_g10301 [Podosphaera aphanis]|nr:hypothetical protein K3495_g10301 [Podosphaera aphanis]